MKLVNMKREERKEPSPGPMEMPQDRYPYGLRLSLGDEEMRKLGLDKALPQAGATMRLEAQVRVAEVEVSDQQGGGKTCRATLQVTDMELGGGEEDEPDVMERAQGLYGKDKG